MLVRILTTIALLAALPATQAASTVAPSKSSKTGKSKLPVQTSYRVEYRPPGRTSWLLKGTYVALATARADVNSLRDAGHHVRFSRSESVILSPKAASDSTPRTLASTSRGISVVSYAQAAKIFREVAARSDISFRYPADGCYARAHLMGLQMKQAGLKPGKAWAFDDAAFAGSAPRLVATTSAHPRGYVSWKYHVAPALKVRRQDGKIYTYVLDPSLHSRPVPLATWQKRMMPGRVGFKPRMEVTAWGQPPHDGKGKRMPGTGYWPGADPRNLTTAARATMAMYKPHQGTSWSPPRTVASRSLSKPADTRDDLSPVPARPFARKQLLDLPK